MKFRDFAEVCNLSGVVVLKKHLPNPCSGFSLLRVIPGCCIRDLKEFYDMDIEAIKDTDNSIEIYFDHNQTY